MAIEKLDATGLKCPQPILKIAAKAPTIKAGDILEVTANCSTFEQDVKIWCERVKKPLLWIKKDGETYTCQIQV
jgi:tRNA 2-thiouridine synthesizing protein A